MELALLALLFTSVSPAGLPELSAYQARCQGEGKRLWGRSLCAPIVAVNPSTGDYRTSRTPPKEPLPAMRANTAIKWGGEDWIMVLEPLPRDPADLANLVFHEAWHVQQAALGFPANTSVAKHLDDASARYLIRLEWAALARALQSSGKGRRDHVAQALAFRARRLRDTPEIATAEREQMRHEGLAAYTGTALSGAPVKTALDALKEGPARPSLGRSFAYSSGPAWGLLLDALRPGWRALKSDADLPDMIGVQSAAIARADDYGGTAVLAEETLSAAQRSARIATAAAATAEPRALRLPLASMSMDFDPNRVTTAPDGSSLYEKISLSDRWGRISVDGSALRISPDFTTAYAPWPVPPGALQLGKGWTIEERPEGGARLVPPTS
jgi:hypothetical protein